MSIDNARAVKIFAPEDLRVVDEPLGTVAPGMVRVKFGAGGICGSDMHYFRHARTGDFVVTSPLTLGHEVAGTIEALGEGVSGLAIGDRVAVNPSRWCGECPQCRAHRENLCENIYFMGSASKTPHMAGGFASSFDAVPAQCVKIPDGVPMEAAALAEPLAVCLHAVSRAGDVSGKRVLVMGAGPIGLLTAMVARYRGAAHVALADIAVGPLAFAAKLGFTPVDLSHADLAAALAEMPDVVFEATGVPAGLNSAIRVVRRGGTIVQIGNLAAGELPVLANNVMSKEIDLKGSFRFGNVFDLAVQLIGNGTIDVAALITARQPLENAVAAFRLALDRSQSVKVVLTAA
ncbi:L-idonate 5-dehydrogenase [Aureimonas fodinaquatilis]|uniref:L-idonate 5-dehydrogenase n=1 Tax=Aureimonas fodinaquatilis TaxID=2565783 RepID=A0A5B0DZ24_9HYPH|nr:L-idonate 5-dehydrogenase [Aureimonas fodinaquatilis]KAA0971105.1 L-idonate 5-dehydrogenase [Aureimonas fodinaquatilis]